MELPEEKRTGVWVSGGDPFVTKGGKRLRRGYTTGSCAAAAAKAAAMMLLTQQPVEQVELMTPKGVLLRLPVEQGCFSQKQAVCGVRKDAGDDPDVTDGALITASVRFSSDCGVSVDGGEGVGRVTRQGLEQPVGAAAINSVPRKMISEQVLEVCRGAGYSGGIQVEIGVPGGRKLAEKTFNPHLGIEGGISILGTTGIVEPMSEQALIDTIRVEIRMAAQKKPPCLLAVPGNYGSDFIQKELGLSLDSGVKFSNFLGECLDFSQEFGFSRVLIVGHLGKLIKAAGGIMNTHSRTADARMEILTAHAAMAGAGAQLCRQLMECASTDGGAELLKEHGLLEPVMESVCGRLSYYLNRRTGGMPQVEAVVFSNQLGCLGKTSQADQWIDLLCKGTF